LLEKSLIRVGNDEYAKTNKSFGLTTLRDQHVNVRGSTLRFEFRGKSGKRHTVDISDPRLARVVKQCRDLPGHELFQYVDDDGVRRDVTSADVNAYLREITGEDYTAKDFRTWAATVLAGAALRECEKADSATRAKKNVLKAIEGVAGVLGNTATVCRKSYIHPAILDAYADGSLLSVRCSRRGSKLRPDEIAALAILQHASRGARRSKAA
jgi:DNA topoisomerase-1